MKVYVSIPITGKDYDEQVKHAVEVKAALSNDGHDAITPFDVVKSPETPYNESMGKCIEALLGCEAIYLCEHWATSRGCCAEYQVARVYGKVVMREIV